MGGTILAGLKARLLGSGVSEPESRPTAEELHNWKALRLETPWGGLAFGSAPAFYALYAIQLGASNAEVGWLTSGPALIQLAWLLPCGWLLQRARSYTSALNLAIILQRLALVLLAGVPLLPAGWRPLGLIVLVTLAALPSAMWGVAWQATAGELFRPPVFARLVGQIWAYSNLAQTGWMLALGWLVDRLRFPTNFQALYLSVGIVTLIPILYMLRLRFPARQPAPAAGRRIALGSVLGDRQRQRALGGFQLGVFIGYIGFFAAAPLLRIYWVRELGGAGGWVGALTAAFLLGATLGNLFWGRRFRPRTLRQMCLIVTLGSMATYALFTAAFHTLPPLLAVCAWAGFFDGGVGLSFLNRLFQIAPARQRATFVAIHSLTINLAAFLGPLGSTAVADYAGVRLALALCGLVGLIGAGLVYWLGWRPAGEMGGAA
jgi:MFS family permease